MNGNCRFFQRLSLQAKIQKIFERLERQSSQKLKLRGKLEQILAVDILRTKKVFQKFQSLKRTPKNSQKILYFKKILKLDKSQKHFWRNSAATKKIRKKILEPTNNFKKIVFFSYSFTQKFRILRRFRYKPFFFTSLFTQFSVCHCSASK